MTAEAIQIGRIKVEHTRTPAGSKLADVPDDRTVFIKVRSPNEEQPTLLVFSRDIVQKLWRLARWLLCSRV